MAKASIKDQGDSYVHAGQNNNLISSDLAAGTGTGTGAGKPIAAALHKGGNGGDAAADKNGGGGSSGSGGTISSDTHFYGQSPPVYPSPNMTGTGLWADASSKARDMVGKMTLAEKISLTSGVNSNTSCSGFTPSIPRLNFTGLCLSDAGNGLRATDFVSSWPSGIHVGASWNKALAFQRGAGMGGEFRTKGVNVLLGPVVGPAGRVVLSGRNWEGFSIDPYLAGSLVSETVSAIQGVGVITSTKHYIGNEQESYRSPFGDTEAVSANIDDRTMHELYLWPFQDAVHAGSGNIMCSYNRVNNSYGCANSKTLNGLLKTELGFQGFVVSDWGAQHAGVATTLGGMDMAMPGAGVYWGEHLKSSVQNGTVPETRIDDMAMRIIAPWYQMGQDQGFPTPGIGMASDLTKPHKIVDARNSSFRSTLFDGAVEGHVLVKNIRNALPLNSPKLMSIYGYSAKNPDQNTPTSGSSSWTFGAESYSWSEFFAGFFTGSAAGDIPIAFNGTIYSGGGSGATSQSLAVSPFDAIVQQAYDDGTALFWDFTTDSPGVNPMSDACFVFGNAFATEGIDRPSTHDTYTDGLVKHVADRCNNTIVVLHNAGIRLVDQFVDHPNVTALIFAHLPGEASGKALVSLLYGKSNPSGKLPYTVARNESDYVGLGPDLPEGEFAKFPQSNFTEGVLVDYRHFDAKNITPRYEFGFGLSYTTFNYSNLSVQKTVANSSSSSSAALFDQYPTGAVLEGGQADLWDVLVEVAADVGNTGAVDGAEVAQLYVGVPKKGEAPVRQLRGFEKPFINATQTATVRFALTRRDLSVWDTVAQRWSLLRGEYTIEVGGSSRDLPLVGKVTI
ncbi:glycoside hydrolase superfamily [Bombardia bombarda]|uniref:beta-glucosidase n=1 Tax=Bombardia bombarda TaxID=252184 RepID=A0AA40CFT4_9PEZI|nr:glycoside hydrolase superfamily [Bombardia bombarda]